MVDGTSSYTTMESSFEAEIHALRNTIRGLRKEKRELSKCDGDWVEFNGHCYLYLFESKSWDDSSAFCEAIDSYLVEITTDAELEFVTDLIRNTDARYGFWSGATDRDQVRRTYMYICQNSKVRIPEKFWRKGEPTITDYRGCVGMYDYNYDGSGVLEFFDLSCKYQRRAVCEKRRNVC